MHGMVQIYIKVKHLLYTTVKTHTNQSSPLTGIQMEKNYVFRNNPEMPSKTFVMVSKKY